DAARVRRRRGPRADLEPAGEVAVLLRHRLRLSRRADRQRPVDRRDLSIDRCRQPRLRRAGRARRRDERAQGAAVPRLLRRGLPHRAPRRRPDRQAPVGASGRRTRAAEGDPVTSYASAGVSIEAGDRAVELMKQWVARATRPEVVGGIGGFAGLFDASALKGYTRPLLATSA